MILSARFLTNVANVNRFDYVQNVEFSEGDAPTVYFQLIDKSKDLAAHGFKPAGRRYMPATAATLQVTVDNIDDAKKITRFCTQPYAQDPSIWALTIMTTDKIVGTSGLKLVLNESAAITNGYVQGAFRVCSAAGY